jgi:hypothetical protein
MQLFRFYQRSTKSEAPMKKATFMEYCQLDVVLLPQTKELMGQIFDTAKGYDTFVLFQQYFHSSCAVHLVFLCAQLMHCEEQPYAHGAVLCERSAQCPY